MKSLDATKLKDGDTDRVCRVLREAVGELQKLPAVAAQIIKDVALVNAVVTLVPHGLGRRPLITLVSPPRGPSTAGVIEEIIERSAGNPDRTRFVALKASGYGATVTVDVEVK